MDKNHFLVSCLESRVEENGKLYGKFFLGPCNPGQGTTLGTALRRNLLSEINGIGIVAAQIKGADHEYCSLPGIRESVLDIILNLKGLALAGEMMPEEPCIGFLNISGPMEVKAKHIRFPFGISPVKKDHHIATLSYDGNLSLKVFLIKGKNYMIHNPSTIPQVEGLNFLSSFFKKNNTTIISGDMSKKTPSFDLHQRGNNEVEDSMRGLRSNTFVEFDSTESSSSLGYTEIQQIKVLQKPSKSPQEKKLYDMQLKSFWEDSLQKDPFSPKKIEKSIYFDAFIELLQRNSLEYKFWEDNSFQHKVKNESSPIPSFQKKVLRNWKIRKKKLLKPRKSISPGFSNLFKKQEYLCYTSTRRSEVSTFKNSAILPVDGLFLPIQRVNFRVETDISSPFQLTEYLILEIWTNGSVHPSQTLYESAENLITSLSYLIKFNQSIGDEKDLNIFSKLDLQCNEFEEIKNFQSNLLSKNFLLNSFQKNKKKETVNSFEKTDMLEISGQESETNEIIPKSLEFLDIANISLPLSLFIQLKKLHINTIQDLSKSLATNSIRNLEEKEINILKIALLEIGIN